MTTMHLSMFYSLIADTDKEDKNGKTSPIDKTKKKEKEKISRYGSFYLRLGAIGKVTSSFMQPYGCFKLLFFKHRV